MEEYRFHGKTMEELAKLSPQELMPMVNADLRRRLKKGFTSQERIFLEHIEKDKARGKPIKTHLREMFILPSFVGLTINVHNGKEFIPVTIKPSMVFHRLGEFALTTKHVKHGAPGLSATRSSSFVPIK